MEEERYLDLNYIPQYESSSFRAFKPGQHHISRYNQTNILIIVTSGILRFEENEKLTEVSAGEYYIQQKGKNHTGKRESDEPRYYYINFDGEYTNKKERALPLRGTYDEKIISICNELYRSEQPITLDIESVPAFKKQSLFFDVLNGLYKKNISFENKLHASSEIARYIVRHFNENITLESLSKEFSYSRDHIIRLFKSQYNITPMKYLCEYRICYAKLMLVSTDLRVHEIATASGYNDLTAFYYAFVRSVGCSPNEFRRRNMSDEPEEQQLPEPGNAFSSIPPAKPDKH